MICNVCGGPLSVSEAPHTGRFTHKWCIRIPSEYAQPTGEFDGFLKSSNTSARIPAITPTSHPAPAGGALAFHPGAAKDCTAPACSGSGWGALAGLIGQPLSPPSGYARVALTNGSAYNYAVSSATKITWSPSSLSWSLTAEAPTLAPLCKTCNHAHPDEPCPLDGEPEVVEDYLIGFRGWNAEDNVLEAVFAPFTMGTIAKWVPGENTARCDADVRRDHAAPHPSCTCGFYLKWALNCVNTGELYGAVKCSGRIIEHGDDGFRAEKAEIVAILDDDAEAAPIAKAYGVPALGYSQLMQHVGEFGEVREFS